MAEFNYQDLYKKYLDEGFGSTSEVLPNGEYPLEIVMLKPGQSKAGKFSLGIRLKVLEGHPLAGKFTWINQTLTIDPSKPDALMMWLKMMQMLGVPASAISQGVAPDKLADYIVPGTRGKGVLRGDRVFNGIPRQDLKSFTVESAPTVTASGVVLGGVAAPAAPVAVPTPAPVAVAVPVAAPVAAPVAPAPAPAAADDTIAALQAQLAALQGQVAPVAAAPAAVPTPSF